LKAQNHTPFGRGRGGQKVFAEKAPIRPQPGCARKPDAGKRSSVKKRKHVPPKKFGGKKTRYSTTREGSRGGNLSTFLGRLKWGKAPGGRAVPTTSFNWKKKKDLSKKKKTKETSFTSKTKEGREKKKRESAGQSRPKGKKNLGSPRHHTVTSYHKRLNKIQQKKHRIRRVNQG